jgi:predicted RNA-binding Zn ribbon-like protein
MTDKTAPPHDLDLVIDFVNTLDLETGVDALDTPAALKAWLAQRVHRDAGRSPSAEDLAAAVRLREALREAMLANNGGPAAEEAARELEAAARRGSLGVHFVQGGEMELAPSAAGLPGTLASLLVPVAHAIADGSWRRVKACRADGCEWAFYDRSRNRSGTWCEMAVCGNRTKVRAYRARGGPAGSERA